MICRWWRWYVWTAICIFFFYTPYFAHLRPGRHRRYFWGTLSDKIGRRPILLVGLASNAVVGTMFGTSQGLWQAILWRGLNGGMSGNIAIAKV